MLTQQLSKEDNKSLWLWILAISSQYLDFKIDKSTYMMQVLDVKKESSRLNNAVFGGNNSQPEDFTVVKKQKFNCISSEAQFFNQSKFVPFKIMEFIRKHFKLN